jgi:hypothetical protein
MNSFLNKNLPKRRKDLNPGRNKRKERKDKTNKIMKICTLKKVLKILKMSHNRPKLTINTN